MRVRMAAPFWGVASSFMWRAASAQMVTPPGSRHLTIEELDAILQTDATKEFDWSEEKAIKAGLLWDGAVQFEWNKAADAELNGQRFPYILCHIGEGLSGYKRKLALAEALNLTENDTDIYYLRTLYNADDYLCVYGQLFASVAAGVTGEEFIVQPLVQTLKFLNNFVDNANQEVGKSNANEQEIYVPTLDVILCPNVAIEENVTADDLAFEVIDSLVQKTIASKLAAAISDTYYLTSEAYGNSTDGSEPSERAQLWNTLLNDYQKAGVCDEAYDMTTWTLTRAADLETGLTYVQIEFNNTGNTDQDQACMLTLALAAASNPDVCSVEMREPVGTSNHYATWLTQSELTNERPFFDVGLNGEGQTVTISDTGIDQNNCYFLDNENPASATYNTNSRKIAQYVPFVDTSDYQYGHGTHVAGTVAGKRDDAAGAADGIAPGAKLAFADIGNSAGSLRLPNDYELLSVGRPYSKIHSASWGSELPFYTTQSRNFDQFMYENDDFLILVAAGNSGAGDAPRTVGSPATGKNVIAVGAHHSTGDSRPRGALGPSYIADFSSRGPTSDGRTKPDILSVGKAVLSAGAVPSEFGECDGKIPGPNSASGGLLSLQGTSMATPVAAGTAAIVRQYFEDGYYPTGERNPSDAIDNPSGALIKAVLINGAQYLSGVDNGASGITSVSPYDNNQNFGRVSLQYSVNLAGKTNVDLQVFDREPILDGDSKDYQVQINTSGGCTFPDLSATLVWVEEGSTPGCLNCVMNDLDLSVSLRGVTYFPNGRNGPDRVNSAERVVVKGVQHGDIATITVNAYNLAKRSQNYALVVTGCFGGTENQLYAEGQCSEFECDNSASNRTRNILLAIFVPLGVILLCCVGGAIIRKKKKRSN